MKNVFYLILLVQSFLLVGTVTAQNSELFVNPLTFKTDLILMDNSHYKGIIHRVTGDSVWVDVSTQPEFPEIRPFHYSSVKMIKLQKKGRVGHSTKTGFIVGSLWGSSMGFLASVGGGSLVGALPFFLIPIAGGLLIGALVGAGEWEKISINGQANALAVQVQRLQEFTKYSSIKPRFYGILD